MNAQKLKQLEERLSSLESDLSHFRSQSGKSSYSSLRERSASRLTLRAHFGRIALDRKPFAVTLDTADGSPPLTRSLTPVRTAILLVLLMDLLERSENSSSTQDVVTRVQKLLSFLDPKAEKETSLEALRVATYRAGQFLVDEFSRDAENAVRFEIDKGVLAVFLKGTLLPPPAISVELTSSDQEISSYLDRSMATSPLSRLRKAKALYVPPGDEGQDRLLLELLDHESPVKQTSLFYRPTIQGFPEALLQKIPMSENRRERQRVAIRAYTSGRIQYTEVLQRKVLWELIKRIPGKGFSLYPETFTAADVLLHLDHLIFQLRNFPTYELVLTDAFFPFYINTLEISRPEHLERIVLFFQQAEEANLRHVSVFGLNDDAVYFSTHDRIIRWIFSHPTTIRNREHVIRELLTVRTSLLENTENPELKTSANNEREDLEAGLELKDRIQVEYLPKVEEELKREKPARSVTGSSASRRRSSE